MNQTKNDKDELSFRDFRDEWSRYRHLARSGAQAGWNLVKHNRWVVFLLFLTFAGKACYEYSTQTPFYISQASYVYTDLHKKVYGEMIDKIQNALQNGAYTTAARELDMPVRQLRSVKDISASNIYGSKLSEDIRADKHLPFYIKVKATSPTLLDTLEHKIEAYFNRNTLAVERMEKQKEILSRKIRYSKRQLALLDSLKTAYTHSLGNGMMQAYLPGQVFDPAALYEKSMEINNGLADMEAALPRLKAVRLLNGFLVADQPEKISFTHYLLESLIYFLIITLAYLGLQSIFKK